MKLRFTPRAISDLLAIAEHIHARNPAAAVAVRDAILASMQALTLFPEIGRRQTVEGVRKLVTRKYGYLVYYSVDAANDEIAILSIQHPARRREYADA
jgi:plasmid stabilization system protein ParE